MDLEVEALGVNENGGRIKLGKIKKVKFAEGRAGAEGLRKTQPRMK